METTRTTRVLSAAADADGASPEEGAPVPAATDRAAAPSEVPSADHAHEGVAPLPVAPVTYERAATTFQAAGDVERLRLLSELSAGERCVTELAEVTGAAMSTVSHRLRVLRDAGLIDRRRDGKHLYYRLADQHVAELVASALDHAAEP